VLTTTFVPCSAILVKGITGKTVVNVGIELWKRHTNGKNFFNKSDGENGSNCLLENRTDMSYDHKNS